MHAANLRKVQQKRRFHAMDFGLVVAEEHARDRLRWHRLRVHDAQFIRSEGYGGRQSPLNLHGDRIHPAHARRQGTSDAPG